MKRYFLLTAMLGFSLCFSQRNELKINTITIFNGRSDLSYERKLGNHFSLGMIAGVGFAERDYVKRNFLLKPYGRFFVSSKNDFRGFFIQGALLYYSNKNLPIPPETNTFQEIGTFNYFGPTVGLGYKWMILKKFPLEIYAETGPAIINNDSWLPLVGELGISLGYRF